MRKYQNRWIALFAVLLLSITIGLSTAASAAEFTGDTLTMTPNATDYIDVLATHGTIKSVTSSDTTLVKITSNTDSRVYIQSTGLTGSCRVTIVAQSITSGISTTITVPVTVKSTSSSSNYGGTTIRVGGTYMSDVYYNITSVTSSAPTIATATVYPLSATQQYVVVTGVSAGTARISYSYTTSPGSSTLTGSISITVEADGSQVSLSGSSSTSTTTSSSATAELAAGKSYNLLSPNYYEVTNVVVSDSSIVSAEATGTAGSMNLKAKALSAGETTISFGYRQTASSSIMNTRITVKVSGTAPTTVTPNSTSTTTTTTSTNDSSSLSVSGDEGISFGKRTSVNTAKVGKSYRLSGIKLNGEAIGADELLWLTPDSDILSVNMTTGVFKCKTKGEATLIAVDLSGSYVKSIPVKVS